MVVYEVTAKVEERQVGAYERYMRETHIPDVFATGCFRSASFERASPGRYRMRYLAPTQADLDRYLGTHAPELRAAFTTRFPEGVTLSRELWVTLQWWGGTVPRSG